MNLGNEKRKNYFISIAKKTGIDPIVAESWYPITKQQFCSHKASLSSIKKD